MVPHRMPRELLWWQLRDIHLNRRVPAPKKGQRPYGSRWHFDHDCGWSYRSRYPRYRWGWEYTYGGSRHTPGLSRARSWRKLKRGEQV